MLENIAISLLNQSAGTLIFISITLCAVGFIVGLAIRQGATLSLRRVPYFIWVSAVFCLVSALPLAWLLTFEAMQNGWLWLLTLLTFGAVFSSGLVYGVLGHARSVNAYGDGSRAWMAIVPLVNFTLQFKRPKNWENDLVRLPIINVLGVGSGMFLSIIGIALGKFAEQQTTEMAQRAENDPALQSASVEFLIRAQGLEEALSQMAVEVPRQRIDEVTTLLRLEAAGTTLRYFYEVTNDVEELPNSIRSAIIKENCDIPVFRQVFEAGATIEHVFDRQNGASIGTVTITRELCGS